jgi:hypothetical protein
VWAAILPVRDNEAAEHSLIGAKMQPVTTKQWRICSAQSVNCARNRQIERAVGEARRESKATRRATKKKSRKRTADGRGRMRGEAALDADLERTFLGCKRICQDARKERPVQGAEPMSGAEHAFL